MSKSLPLLAIFLFAVFCQAQQPTSKPQPKPPRPMPAARVSKATLAAVVAKGHACPVNVSFNGSITTTGPGEVKYTWVSFDGGTWPERTVKFAKAETERVGELRHAGASGTGWMQLKVLSPNVVMSPRANYRVTCVEPKK